MTGYRQSALLLHGLSASDQQWILQNLAENDQSALRDHLAELKDLGVPADPSMLARLGVSSNDRHLDDLQRASAAEMRLVLEGEPLWMVKQVLTLEIWPWHDEFVSGMNQTQREKLQQIRLEEATGTRVQASLRNHLKARLTDVKRTETTGFVEPTPKQNWIARIMQLVR